MINTEWFGEKDRAWMWTFPLVIVGLLGTVLETYVWVSNVESVGSITASQVFSAMTCLLILFFNSVLILTMFASKNSSRTSGSSYWKILLFIWVLNFVFLLAAVCVFIMHFPTLRAIIICHPGPLTACPRNYGVTETFDHQLIKLGDGSPISSYHYNSLIKKNAFWKIAALFVEIVGTIMALVDVFVWITITCSTLHRGVENEDTGGVQSPDPGEDTLGDENSRLLPPIKTCAWISLTARDTKTAYHNKGIFMLRLPYFWVAENGTLELCREKGCVDINGFSEENLKDIKRHSTEQLVTVDCLGIEHMRKLLETSGSRRIAAITLVDFVTENDLTGVDIEFVRLVPHWTIDDYSKYKQFIISLLEILHSKDKKLAICTPVWKNVEELFWGFWDYSDFTTLSIDYITPLAINYFLLTGFVGYRWGGDSVAWLEGWAKHLLKMFPKNLVMGISSGGYRQFDGRHFELAKPMTLDDIKRENGYPGERDRFSAETTKYVNGFAYVSNDAFSLDKKKTTLQSVGVEIISVSYLGGGNEWFS